MFECIKKVFWNHVIRFINWFRSEKTVESKELLTANKFLACFLWNFKAYGKTAMTLEAITLCYNETLWSKE